MNLPGHRYFGPGNKLTNGDPEDDDDVIALLHDIQYELADSDSDIQAADAEAAFDFFENYIHSGNYHSAIGALGLSTKYVFEKIFGVKYGMAPPRKLNRGNERYAHINSKVWKKYRELKANNPAYTTKEFKQSGRFKELTREYATEFDGQRPVGRINNDANTAPADSPAGNSDFAQFDNADFCPTDIGDISLDSWPDFGSAGDTHESPVEDPQPSTSTGATGGGSPSTAIEEPSAKKPKMDVRAIDQMQRLQIQQQQQMEVESPGASGGAGVAGGSGGINGGCVSIPKTIQQKSGHLTFRKNWILYSYGYNWEQLKEKESGYMIQCTSLSALPVDLIGSYMSKQEYDCLPTQSKITKVKAIVTPLGVRTAFDAGATITQNANTEHVPIVVTCEGINEFMSVGHFSFGTDAAKPMIPTSWKTVLGSDINSKYYGGANWQTDPFAMCMGIPRAAPQYLGFVANHWVADATPIQKHVYGPLNLQAYMDRHLLTSCIGVPLINYEYNVKKGFIGPVRDVYLSLGNNTTGTAKRVQAWERPYLHQTRKYKINENDITEGTDMNLTIGDHATDINAAIEKEGHIWSTTTHAEQPHAQPIPYIGILPTPALNPGAETTSIQNTSMYYSFSTEMIVKFDFESMWTHKAAYNTRDFPIRTKDKSVYACKEIIGGYTTITQRASSSKTLETDNTLSGIGLRKLRNRTVRY